MIRSTFDKFPADSERALDPLGTSVSPLAPLLIAESSASTNDVSVAVGETYSCVISDLLPAELSFLLTRALSQ